MDFSLVSTIINIVLVATFVLSLLLGFLRGFKKSLNNLIANVVVIILAISFCGMIAKTLAGFDISFITGDDSPMTLSKILSDMFVEELSVTNEQIPATLELVTSASIGIMRLPAYLLLLIVGLIIVKPLLKLLLRVIIPIGKGKTIGFRFIALGVSFVSYVILMFFLTAPVFGILGMANHVVKEIDFDKADQKEEMSNSDNDSFEELTSGFALSIAKTVFGDEFKLQSEFTGKLIEIKTSYGTINLKNEIDHHSLLVGIIWNNIDDENKMIDNILENSEMILLGFRESELLNVTMPSIIEIVRLEASDENIDFDKLIETDWSIEKQNIVDILRALCEFADTVNIDLENPKSMLGNPNLPLALKNIGTSLNDSGVFKDVILVYLNDLVQESIISNSEELGNLAHVLDLTKLDLTKDLSTIGYILNDLYEIIFSENGEFNILNNYDVVDSLIKNVFNLSTVKNNEADIVQAIVEFTDIDVTLEQIGLKLNYDNVNWDTEINNIKSIMVDLFKLISDAGYQNLAEADLFSLIMKEENYDQTKNIVEKITKSQLIKDSLIGMISNTMSQLGLDNWKSEKLIAYELSEESHTEWAQDQILKVIELYDDMQSLINIEFESMTNKQLVDLQEKLKKINQLEIVSLDSLMPMINNALYGASLEINVLDKIYDINASGGYDSNKDEWDQEITRLIEIIKQLNNIYFNRFSIKNETYNLANVLEQMKQSYIFGNDLRNDGDVTIDDNIFNVIILEILSENGLLKTPENNGFIDSIQAENDDWSRYDYSNELVIIRDYNINASIQNDTVVSQLQTSEIAKKYFDIAGTINEKIANISFDYNGNIITLKDYINSGQPLTNDQLYERNWKHEIDDLNRLIEGFNSGFGGDFTTALVIVAYSNKGTLASEAANEICDIVFQQ